MRRFEEMCESSAEIQSEWRCEKGDRFYIKNDLYFFNISDESSPRLSILKQSSDLDPVYKEGINYIFKESFFGYFWMNNDVWFDKEGLRGHSFWVPYQHQLQKKLRDEYNNESDLLRAFISFVTHKEFNIIRYFLYSIEELWLLLYIKIFYDKKWNDENEEWEGV